MGSYDLSFLEGPHKVTDFNWCFVTNTLLNKSDNKLKNVKQQQAQ